MKFLRKYIVWLNGHPAFSGVVVGVFLSLLLNSLTLVKEVHNVRNYDEVHFANETDHVLENRTVAEQLFDQVKVLCLIFPKNASMVSQLPHVFQTWGKRCNKFIAFVQYHKNVVDLDITNNFTTVYMTIGAEKKDDWRLTVKSFIYLNKTKMLDAYDWFLRTDTNSYIVMENLRFHLFSQVPDLALHFDNSIEPEWGQSQQVVPSLNIWNRRAILVMLSNSHTLHDVRRIIRQGSGKDLKKRFIHFPSYPSNKKNIFMQKMSQFSDYPVGFRQVTNDLMFALEYLFYNLHPYGLNVFFDMISVK